MPSQTAWENKFDIYKTKLEALDVLFVGHRTFPTVGMSIMREYVIWCRRLGTSTIDDFRLSSAIKAKQFMEVRIAASKERWLTDTKKRNSLIQECAVYSFRVAITHLDALARWQGYASLPLLQSEEICVLQNSLLKEQAVARAETRDYAASSRFLTKRLTLEDRQNIVISWWNGEAAFTAKTASGREWAQVRGLMICCLQRCLGRRGADLRSIRMSMLFTHTLPNTSPVAFCPVIGASLRHVKESHENVEHLLGWARARDRLECPLSAMALYLVYMNDIAGDNIIEILRECVRTKSTSWHAMMLIQGKDTPSDQVISYTTHNQVCHAGMDAAGISDKTAVTHLDRNTVGCELIERGVSVNDAGLYQGWYHNVAADCYLRGAFKTEPMLIAHGWDGGRSGFECWWESESERDSIPKELSNMVFPGLEGLVDDLQFYGTHAQDKSIIQFVNCLLFLQRTYILDAVVHQDTYPKFPAYVRHPLFDHPASFVQTAWLRFKTQELERLQEAPKKYKADKDAWVVNAVKDAFGHLGLATAAETAHAARVSKVDIDEMLAPPVTEKKIPNIKEPDDLYTFYADWIKRCRSYFQTTSRPPWDKQYGSLARAHKVRYCHIRPYVEYLDTIDNDKVRGVIDILDEIRRENRVTSANFIKYCFYALYHGVCASKPPDIMPNILRDAMVSRGLAPITPKK